MNGGSPQSGASRSRTASASGHDALDVAIAYGIQPLLPDRLKTLSRGRWSRGTADPKNPDVDARYRKLSGLSVQDVTSVGLGLECSGR